MAPQPAASVPAGGPRHDDAEVWRRGVARFLDWLIFGILTAWAFWPSAARELPGIGIEAGVSGLLQFLFTHAFGASVRATAQEAVAHARELLAVTFALQVLVVWAYEWLGTAAFGTTIGKRLLRVRVDLPGASRMENVVPALVRATAAVWPGCLAVSASLVAFTGSWTAFLLAVLFAGIAAADGAPVLSDGLAAHDMLSSSRAVDSDAAPGPRFEWRPRRNRHQLAPGPRPPNHDPYDVAGRPPNHDPYDVAGHTPGREARRGPPHRNPYS